MVLMTRKGGGRESGAPLSDDVPPKTPGTDEGGTGAANPAAFDCGSSGLSWSHIEHDHNRMRALEAELVRAETFRKDLSNAFLADARDLKARAEKAEARVKELEADLARHQDEMTQDSGSGTMILPKIVFVRREVDEDTSYLLAYERREDAVEDDGPTVVGEYRFVKSETLVKRVVPK